MAKDRYINVPLWGVTKHYGHRTTSLARGSEVHTTGRDRELVFEFDHDDLPRWHSHDTTANIRIPDGSTVKEVRFEVTDGFQGDADAQLQFGLMDSNGDILSHTYFGALEGFVGKSRGFSAYFPNTGVSYAGFNDACDGENYALLQVCLVGELTCGEARMTIVIEPPFYAYHYDGKDLATQRTGTFMPNRNDCCREECKMVQIDPCNVTRVVIDPVPALVAPEVLYADTVTEVVPAAPTVICEGEVTPDVTTVRSDDCPC